MARLILYLSLFSIPGIALGNVHFSPIRINPDYADAIAPNVLQLACASDSKELENYFLTNNISYDPNLLRNQDNEKCHVYYLPSLIGFKASPDNSPITELFFNVDALSFLSNQTKDFGDALSIFKNILPQINRPLKINIGIPKGFDPKLIAASEKFHFGNSIHSIHILENADTSKSIFRGENWAQDYLKSGVNKGRNQILITRRLFESVPSQGDAHEPFLSSLNDPRFIRSQLSWEGGDLQFIEDPKNRENLILFYGNGAKDYWGKDLTQEEYAYVLKQEFGADSVVNTANLASHVDYFLSFIPEEKSVLVAVPVKGNQEVACSALKLLLGYIGASAPSAVEIKKLGSLICDNAYPFSAPSVLAQLQKAKIEFTQHRWEWVDKHPSKKDWQPRLLTYLKPKCGEDATCMQNFLASTSGQGQLIKDEPELARDWVEANIVGTNHQNIFASYADILFSQFEEKPLDLIHAKISELQQLGFHVIQVPALEPSITSWAGLSYANNLLVDHTLFLPTFGLGQVESSFIEGIKKELPSSYNVIPVNARLSLILNGAIHCQSGIVR